MANRLNVRKLVTKEFEKEFRRIYGRQPLDEAVGELRGRFDLQAIQVKVKEEILSKKEEQDQQVIRKYHRNNLRYLTKYFCETLIHQLQSAKVSLKDGLKDEKLMETTVKTFKQNPQCKLYH